MAIIRGIPQLKVEAGRLKNRLFRKGLSFRMIFILIVLEFTAVSLNVSADNSCKGGDIQGSEARGEGSGISEALVF